MKNTIYIRIVVASLLLAIFLPMAISAAAPRSVEPRWTNTSRVTCGIIDSGNIATARASITGYTGTVVKATAILSKIKDGIITVEYMETTPENNPYPFASFAYEFVPESNATYQLVLRGTVSANGYDEPIYFTDTKSF